MSCGAVIQVDTHLQTAKKATKWGSYIYGFFGDPYVEKVKENGKIRISHTFPCNHCKSVKRRYQDTKDSNSSSGLTRHANGCIGKKAVQAAKASGKTADEVRKSMSGVPKASGDGNIASIFDNQRKAGARTYSNIQHTPVQTR